MSRACESLVGTTVSGTAVGELFVLDLLEATAPGASLSSSIEELLPTAFGVDVTALRETDLNGDGAVNTLDVLEFLNLWTASDAAADFNGDGAVNTLDVLEFLNQWNAGC